SLLVLVVNVSIASAIGGWRKRGPRALGYLVVVGLVMALPVLTSFRDADGTPVKVAMIQGNAPEGTENPHFDDAKVIRDHARLTDGLETRPDLVIWPESAFDLDPLRDPVMAEPLYRSIGLVQTPFLVGAFREEFATSGPTFLGNPQFRMHTYYNASLFFGPDGSLLGEYHKRHLVPFGERVPLRPFFSRFVKAIERVPNDLTPGSEATVFDLPQGRFASVICFESTFPELVRSSVVKGARLLVVSTNNSSFERTAASAQHVAFSQLRAAEHRVWIAHAALTGISAVVAPDGRVLERTGLFEPAVLTPTMRMATGITPYGRWGDWLPISTLIILGILAVAALLRRPWRTRPPQPFDREPTLVMIPTYQEAMNIEAVMTAVMEADRSLHILVVDDDSGDGTADLASAAGERWPGRCNVLVRPGKTGLGRAYVDGMRWGLEHGYATLVEMDADLSHDPGALPGLLEKVETYDVVIGSRYIKGGEVTGWSRARHTLSRAGNIYVETLLGMGVKDATSGFRAYRREVLEAIDLDSVRSDGYAFQIDMTYRARRRGFTITEYPITFSERRAGESKMSRSIIIEAVIAVARWALRDTFTRRGPSL
ncbi:MAG TPA: apolipoprotein N-acyltransferase, partial [Actinomycetota bacterium]|nr:apolipoprotein N-acyltransferase [Actinomycetota bacterium]